MVVANASLRGSEGHVVVNSVAFENLDFPVIHAHGHADDDRPLRRVKSGQDIGVEIDERPGFVELFDCVLKERTLFPNHGSGL